MAVHLAMPGSGWELFDFWHIIISFLGIKITASGERLFRLRSCSEDDTIFLHQRVSLRRYVCKAVRYCQYRAVFYCSFFSDFFPHCDINPSICSNKLSFMVAHIGSNMKSIPSRRASFAAGTKSLSPAIRII